MYRIKFISKSCELVLRWMPLKTFDDTSTLVQAMACCRQPTSHYLSQCWPGICQRMASLGHNVCPGDVMDIGQQPPNILSNLQYKPHFNRPLNCWSLRCSWSITCRRCSNYIFILHLTLGFNILRKDDWKPRRETFKFWDLVHLILENLW